MLRRCRTRSAHLYRRSVRRERRLSRLEHPHDVQRARRTRQRRTPRADRLEERLALETKWLVARVFDPDPFALDRDRIAIRELDVQLVEYELAAHVIERRHAPAPDD